ncbi:hypothetical protein ACH5RR_027218 [Cinchona calisaya]|uniref:LNS2/PITP domain-containing protein n=1 Tax=Cinchona calisaya TaxID=153742 RepID=A0ABD2Z4T3_9GENT
MRAVGKVGSFISKSVYTVSGPFHPFGGAVDIIVVEQQDGSYKSSPWYVRFGKFQGVLKAKEKGVNVSVNGVEADFHMYLDHKGEAYFLKEVDVGEGDTLSSPLSSGEDTDGQSNDRKPIKAKRCNIDAYQSESVTQIDIGNGNVISRTNSRRSRIMGLVFGRKSIKGRKLPGDECDAGVVRSESLERAEIAADLLEVKWSTNLDSHRRRKDNASRLSSQIKSEKDEDNNVAPLVNGSNLSDSIMESEIGFPNNQEGHGCKSLLTKPEGSIQETGVEMSCLTSQDLIGTSSVEDGEPNSKLSSKTDNIRAADTNPSASTIEIISDIAGTESKNEDSVEFEECPGNKYQKDQVCNEMRNGFTDSSFSVEGNGNETSFLYCETSVSSSLELDGSNKQGNGELCLSTGGCERVYVETVQTTGLVCEVNSQAASGFNAKESSSSQELLENQNDCMFSLDGKATSSSSDFVTETYSQTITLQPAYASAEDTESQSIFTVSTFSSLTSQAPVENTVCQEDEMSKRESPVKPVLDPIQLVNILASEISEEEQLLFGDFDDFKISSVRHTKEPVSPDYEEKEGDPPLPPTETEEINESFVPGIVSGLSEDKSFQVNLPEDANDFRRKLKTVSSHVDIPASITQSEEVSRIARSLPNMPAHNHDLLSNVNREESNENQSSKSELIAEDAKNIEELKNGAVDNANRKMDIDDEKDFPKMKVTEKKTRSITPTSEQLASLNLKEGRNSVVFTFSTPMLGQQQVDARIYLWKWDTRVVISDVDGTITRSDLLGQVMPLVGVDWSQTGVAHLFSAIKENGYQLLFLSARAISQAYHTRQFLLNLKQDGKVLPEGPVVISPDGLFPSLYREVVRRAPHEFKIACLEDIKALFPADRNPFYAGFGNRDTDEISYLKVGIPKGKIFIINPKGEIVVNRRVETKTYTSLHALVHDMFPPMSSSEQEDFNSWNYWKLPPPAIDI